MGDRAVDGAAAVKPRDTEAERRARPNQAMNPDTELLLQRIQGLEEELYMEPTPGINAKGKEGIVFRLCCALYGLKQARCQWWKTLSNSMKELGFQRLHRDPGSFVYHRDKLLIVAIIYVDDALFCGVDKTLSISSKPNLWLNGTVEILVKSRSICTCGSHMTVIKPTLTKPPTLTGSLNTLA